MGSLGSFERFREIVLDDLVLQRRLRVIQDWPPFVEEVVAAAAERGLDLSPGEVLAAREESRRSWLERWI